MLVKKNNQRGISVIEILVAIAIISISLIALFGLTTFSLKVINQTEKNIMAVNLASEVMEAVRSVRDENWNNISTLVMGADYHPVQSGASPSWQWTLQTGSESVLGDKYTRQVVFENVSRGANDNIEDVYNPANNDPDTKKAKVSVSWSTAGIPRQIEIVTYLTNWR